MLQFLGTKCSTVITVNTYRGPNVLERTFIDVDQTFVYHIICTLDLGARLLIIEFCFRYSHQNCLRRRPLSIFSRPSGQNCLRRRLLSVLPSYASVVDINVRKHKQRFRADGAYHKTSVADGGGDDGYEFCMTVAVSGIDTSMFFARN